MTRGRRWTTAPDVVAVVTHTSRRKVHEIIHPFGLKLVHFPYPKCPKSAEPHVGDRRSRGGPRGYRHYHCVHEVSPDRGVGDRLHRRATLQQVNSGYFRTCARSTLGAVQVRGRTSQVFFPDRVLLMV